MNQVDQPFYDIQYNRLYYLLKFVASALILKFPNFEFVLVCKLVKDSGCYSFLDFRLF